MKLLTKYTDYAIRAVCLMAKDKERLFTVSELSEDLKIPRPFLRMILQRLSREKILTSYRGKGGGFGLSLPAERIFIIDMIEMFQGPVKFDNCLINKKLCADIKTCPMKKKLEEIGDYINSEFGAMTIKSLIE